MREHFKFNKYELVTSYIVQWHGAYWTPPSETYIVAALNKIAKVRGGPRIQWARTEHWDGRRCFKTEEDAQLMYETLVSSHPKEWWRIVEIVATRVRDNSE